MHPDTAASLARAANKIREQDAPLEARLAALQAAQALFREAAAPLEARRETLRQQLAPLEAELRTLNQQLTTLEREHKMQEIGWDIAAIQKVLSPGRVHTLTTQG